MKKHKLPSLTIFFPFYNDAGTVNQAITQAYSFGRRVARKVHVIALHGGRSKDGTFDEIQKLKKKFPDLEIINKMYNREGYAVIKHGLFAAQAEWVFYTDGDLQYDVSQLIELVKVQHQTGVDVVNGFKVGRQDTLSRQISGELYRRVSKFLFNLPIRDVDCDFRLIRNSQLKKFELVSRNASILPELIVKLRSAGASFAEIPVQHYARRYGRSNYSVFKLFYEKILGDLRLWMKLNRLNKNNFFTKIFFLAQK